MADILRNDPFGTPARTQDQAHRSNGGPDQLTVEEKEIGLLGVDQHHRIAASQRHHDDVDKLELSDPNDPALKVSIADYTYRAASELSVRISLRN